MSRYCIRCGKKNSDNRSVCEACGLPFEGASLETSQKEAPRKGTVHKETQISGKSFAEIVIDEDNFVSYNTLFKDNIVSEKNCENDFMYIFDEKATFSTTEYRVLNSSRDNRMIPCQKIKYNGKGALFYMTGDLKALDVYLPVIDESRFLSVIGDLFLQINKLASYGFLSESALDIRIKRIFVDPHMGRIYLTYIPLNQRCYPDSMYLERELRANLVYIIEQMKHIHSANILEISRMLDDPSCSLEMIISVIRRMSSTSMNTGR